MLSFTQVQGILVTFIRNSSVLNVVGLDFFGAHLFPTVEAGVLSTLPVQEAVGVTEAIGAKPQRPNHVLL